MIAEVSWCFGDTWEVLRRKFDLSINADLVVWDLTRTAGVHAAKSLISLGDAVAGQSLVFKQQVLDDSRRVLWESDCIGLLTFEIGMHVLCDIHKELTALTEGHSEPK